MTSPEKFKAALSNPAEFARHVLIQAFDSSQKNQRGFMRSVKLVLSLAKNRGYDNADQLLLHFKNPDNHRKPASTRLLKTLFEYVSAEEFSSIAQMNSKKEE